MPATVQVCKVLFSIRPEREVAQTVDNVLLAYNLIVPASQFSIHFVYRTEGTIAKFDYVGMTVVLICCPEDFLYIH